MSFRIEGIDEAKKMLDDLICGVDPNVFVEWANKIENKAKQFCNDPENKRIKLKHTQRLGLEYEFADKEAIDCVIESIKQHKNSMPMILKDIYERVIIDLEAKKKEFKESS